MVLRGLMACNIDLIHKQPRGLGCGQLLQEKGVHKRAAGVVGYCAALNKYQASIEND